LNPSLPPIKPPTPEENLSHATVRGTAWTYAAFYSGKLIVFIATAVLARLLSRDDFGVVGYVVTLLSILDVLKDLGIGYAVIYYRKDNRAINTAFWLGLLVNLILFIVIWVTAPLIGAFFNDPRAIWVSRILAFNFPLSALIATQEALLIKDLAFNRKFLPDFAKATSKGIFSITLALVGFGPWSLVVGHLLGTLTSILVIWKIVPWRPALEFSRQKSRLLLKFGLPMVGVNAIGVLVLNVDYLLVGRYMSAEALGVYTLAFRIPELVILQFCALIAQVIFPVFTKIKDDRQMLYRGFLETTRYVAIITVPLGLGMLLLSEAFVLALFTDKWLDAIPVMRAISAYALLLSLGFNAGDVYKALGQPGVLTRISFVKAIILVPALYWAVTVPASLIAVAWVQVGVAVVGTLLNLGVAIWLLKSPPIELFKAFQPSLAAGAGLSLAVLAFLSISTTWSPWLVLVFGTLTGGLAYLGTLYIFYRDISQTAIDVLRGAFRRD
jgi:O-antigen/teichoic acid export membrane protein